MDSDKFSLQDKLNLASWTDMAEVAAEDERQKAATQDKKAGSRFDSNKALNRVHIQISERTMATIALLVSGMSLMGMCWALDAAHEAKRKSEYATMRSEGCARALIAHGIDPYPHLPGESP